MLADYTYYTYYQQGLKQAHRINNYEANREC